MRYKYPHPKQPSVIPTSLLNQKTKDPKVCIFQLKMKLIRDRNSIDDQLFGMPLRKKEFQLIEDCLDVIESWEYEFNKK